MKTIEAYRTAWRELPAEELDKYHQQAINGQLNLPRLQREALFDVWHECHDGDIKGL